MLLRPLYESWLLRSTTAPLALWQRHLLLRALQRDEALRCLAAELAQFSQEHEVPADLQAPDLRARLRHLVSEKPAPSPLWRPGWVTASALLALLAGGLALWTLDPAQPTVELARVQQDEEAAALRIPSLTPTPTPSPSVTPTSTPGPEPAADKAALP